MKQLNLAFLSFLLVALGLISQVAYAAVPSGDIAIIEIKMTSSESVVIENISPAAINLQNYILEYFNRATPTSFNIPTSSQQLPNFNLLPQQSFLLSGDTMATCGAAGVANLGMSLSDTSGYFEVVKVTNLAGVITYTPQDYVNWTSTSSGADIVSVPSASADAAAVWYRNLSSGVWSKYGIDTTPCNLFVTVAANSGTTYVQWASGEQAPSIITTDSLETASIPASDIGLAAPQITELLPNPAPPQSDNEDEFIELYNPNNTSFDLTGFKLEVGTSTVRTYAFPAGTSLEAKSFKVFYSVDTNLAMSNSGGQARLKDPLGTVISQSDVYGSAKDGQSFALAGGKWLWATNPSPGASNTVTLANSSNATKPGISGAVSGASVSGGSLGGRGLSVTTGQASKLHGWTIAVIGAAALLYAGYEYRNDLANNLYRLRRYAKTRRAVGKPGKATTSDRISGRFGRWQNNLRKRLGPRPKKRK